MSEVVTEELATLLEMAEARGLADMQGAVPAELAAEFGIGLQESGSAVGIVAQRAGMFDLNRVVGLGIGEPASEAQVDVLVEFYRRRGARCLFQIAPLARPAELPSWLQARGLVPGEPWAKLYRPAGPRARTRSTMQVERIENELAPLWSDIFFQAFGIPFESTDGNHALEILVQRPGWLHYIGFADGLPLALGSLYVWNKIGWLGFGATASSQRKRDLLGPLNARRIADACDSGCAWLTLETVPDMPERPSAAYRSAARSGFQLAYLRDNYIFAPETT